MWSAIYGDISFTTAHPVSPPRQQQLLSSSLLLRRPLACQEAPSLRSPSAAPRTRQR